MSSLASLRARPLFQAIDVSASPVLSVVAALLVLLETSHFGIGMSRDAADYIHGGQSFIHGDGLRYIQGWVWVDWPPLYPVMLGIAAWPFGHAMDAARVVNALCLGALVLISGLWLERHCQSRVVASIGTLGLVLLVPLWDVVVYAWSEVPFVVFTTSALLMTGAACARPSLRLPVIAGVFTALAWLTRYMGATVAVSCMLALLVWPSYPWLLRIKQTAILGGIAAIPNGLWLIRNEYVSHTLMGPRVAASASFQDILRPVPAILAGWVLPGSFPYSVAIASIAVALVVAAGTGLLAPYLRQPLIQSVAPYALPLLLFVVVYFVWLVLSEMTVYLTPIDNRYLTPMAPPLLLLFCLIIDRVVVVTGHRAVIVAAFALCLLYPAWHLRDRSAQYLSVGIQPYSTRAMKNSATLALVRRLPLPGLLFARDPFAVYALSGKVSLQGPIRVHSQWGSDPSVQTLQEAVHHQGRAILIWTRCCLPQGIRPATLTRWFTLRPLETSSDGGIYVVSRRRRSTRQ